jgi:hypothetical protein
MGRNRFRYPKEVVVVKDEPTIGCGGILFIFFLLGLLGTMFPSCAGG